MNATAIKSKPEVSSAPVIRVIKIANAPSLSASSTLTYHIGVNEESQLFFRVYVNSGGGYFSQEWLSLIDIQKIFSNVPSDKFITSFLLYPLFQGKSLNSPGFMLAALLQEKLVSPSTVNDRGYECTDGKEFFAEVQALIESAVDLKVVEKPKKSAPVMAEVPIKKSASKSGQKNPI